MYTNVKLWKRSAYKIKISVPVHIQEHENWTVCIHKHKSKNLCLWIPVKKYLSHWLSHSNLAETIR